MDKLEIYNKIVRENNKSASKTEIDTFTKMNFISSLKVLENGKEAVFVRTHCDKEKNKYLMNLFLLNEHKEIKQLTFDDSVSSFFVGKSERDVKDRVIYFFAKRNDEEKEKSKNGLSESSLYRLSLNGGEASKSWSLPMSISNLIPLKDGRFILFASYEVKEPEVFLETKDERKKYASEKKENDYFYEIEEIPFYLNGAGYIYGKKSRAFLFNPDVYIENLKNEKFEILFNEANKEERMKMLGLISLTSTQENCSEIVLNDDESEALIMLNKNSKKLDIGTSVYKVSLPAKTSVADFLPDNIVNERELLLDEKERKDIFDIFYLKEKIYAFISEHKINGINENARFFKFKQDTKSFERISDREYCLGNSVGTDIRYGGNKSRKIFKDEYYSLITDYNAGKIAKINIENGEVKVLDFANKSTDGFDFLSTGEVLSVSFEGAKLQELYCHTLIEDNSCSKVDNEDRSKLNLADVILASDFEKITYSSEKLSFFNDEKLGKDFRGIEVEILSFEIEGEKMEGFVLLPLNYDENKKYPAILDIHGGPKTVYGTIYYHEMQYWASKGYFVFFMNPHGSDGRGDKYSNIFGHYGENDYRDLMKFTDLVLEKYQAIDGNKVAVTGGSYGGFMTNWIISHTNRFKAAATQRSISNWLSFYGNSDIGYFFVSDQCKGSIFDEEGVKNLWNQSPIKYINNMKTPTLIIHSDEDYRCPLEQGIQLFTALIDKNVPSKLVQFRAENHDLSRTGRIKSRLKRLDEITQWIDKYTLQNIK